MNCYIHENKEAVNICTSCGRGICQDCNMNIGKNSFCRRCINSGRVTLDNTQDVATSLSPPTIIEASSNIDISRYPKHTNSKSENKNKKVVSIGATIFLGCLLGIFIIFANGIIINSLVSVNASYTPNNLCDVDGMPAAYIVNQNIFRLGPFGNTTVHEFCYGHAYVFAMNDITILLNTPDNIKWTLITQYFVCITIGCFIVYGVQKRYSDKTR